MKQILLTIAVALSIAGPAAAGSIEEAEKALAEADAFLAVPTIDEMSLSFENEILNTKNQASERILVFCADHIIVKDVDLFQQCVALYSRILGELLVKIGADVAAMEIER